MNCPHLRYPDILWARDIYRKAELDYEIKLDEILQDYDADQGLINSLIISFVL